MKFPLKKLADQVMVITGASSGIGLTTARAAAREGAKLVLAARSESALRELTEDLNAAAVQAIYVVADVSKLEDVERIAAAAISSFGHFDTWVNNAGVGIFGPALTVPVEDEKRLFDVNYWGAVYGSRVAATHLREHGGSIINVGSVACDLSLPLQAAYSASKHALKAYTNALRTELEKENVPVWITLIKPTAIATPFFKHAKTYMDGQPTEPSPMYAPDAVAAAILRAAVTPLRDVLVGGMAPVQSAMGLVFPRTGDKLAKAVMFDGQKSDRQPEPGGNQILNHPSGDLRERAEYDTVVRERSLYTEIATRPNAVKTALLAAAGVSIATLVLRKLNTSDDGSRPAE